MKKFIIIIFTLFFSEITLAQYAYFGTRGTIEFDKVTYTRAQVRGWVNNQPQGGMGRRMFGGDINNIPESSTQKMTLAFDEKSTLMTLNNLEENSTQSQRRSAAGQVRVRGRQAGGGGGQFRVHSMGPNSSNQKKVLYQDLKNHTSTIQLEIDDTYILTDSLNDVTWRFTDEYRDIAGFDCRRVNGATADSLYIIAFYTDQIPVSGGPALAQGLPGMIMGLVIPEMHIQYWATKVDYSNETTPNDWKDKKAKPMTLNEFSESLGRFFRGGRDNRSNRRNILEQLIY